MLNGVFVCDLAQLPPGSARGFTVQTARGPLELIVLHWQGRVLAYENRCPHTGVNLDWVPGRFMDADGRHLQCATHGALFRPADGRCVSGPCAGDALRAVPVQVKDGAVWLQETTGG